MRIESYVRVEWSGYQEGNAGYIHNTADLHVLHGGGLTIDNMLTMK